VICINQQVHAAADTQSHRWSASYVITYVIILVVFLTLVVAVFAIMVVVNLGHSDLHLHKSQADSRQSPGDISIVLTADKQSPLEQDNIAAQLQLGQFVPGTFNISLY